MKTDTRGDDSYISDGGEPAPSIIDNVANRLTTITDRSALVLHSEMTRVIMPSKIKKGLKGKLALVKQLSKLSSTRSKKIDEESEKESTIAD